MANHQIARSAGDFLVYEAGYWAIPTILTGGAATVAGKGVAGAGYLLKTPALVRAGNFIKPTISTGTKVYAQNLGTKAVVSKTIQPATGFFGRQSIVQSIGSRYVGSADNFWNGYLADVIFILVYIL